MPSFKGNYKSHMSDNWDSRAYINYDYIKNYIHSSKRLLEKSGNNVTDSNGSLAPLPHNGVIIDLIDSEMDKIFEHVEKRLSFLTVQVETIVSNAYKYQAVSSPTSESARDTERNSHKSSLNAIHADLKDFEVMRRLNTLACIKLLKKHDKHLSGDGKWYQPIYPYYEISTHCLNLQFKLKNQILALECQVVECFAALLSHNDKTEAALKLDIQKRGFSTNERMKNSFKAGLGFMVLLWFLWESVIPVYAGYNLWQDPNLYIYVFIGNLLAFKALWGVEVYIWDHAHVSYMYLLDIHDRFAPNYVAILSEVSLEAIVYIFNILFYVKSRVGFGSERKIGGLYFLSFLPPSFFPLSLVAGALALRLWESVMYVKNHYDGQTAHGIFSPPFLFKLFTAPFSPVTLKESYAGDVLTSLGRVLFNGASAACLIVTGGVLLDPKHEKFNLHKFGKCTESDHIGSIPPITVLNALFFMVPLWLRYSQCVHMVFESAPQGTIFVWPHSANCLKYLLSILVTLISLIYPLGIGEDKLHTGVVLACLLVVTCYTTYWDVVNDWGLFQILPSCTAKVQIFDCNNKYSYIRIYI